MANRYIKMHLWIWILLILCGFTNHASSEDPPASSSSSDFAPKVTATCKGVTMNIKVVFSSPYNGAVHARDYRNPNCMALGNGSTSVALSLNLQAKQNQPDYCGILVSNRTEERSVQLAVRVHKTLELADDKFYVITCGKTGFARDENSHVVLKFLEKDRRVRETIYGREYTVRAEVTQPNGTYGIRVTNCFAFDKKNLNITLIDDRGCPVDTDIMTRFYPSEEGVAATAIMKSMFKFPEGSEVHLQCDIVQCKGKCPDEDPCLSLASFAKSGKSGSDANDGTALAATTVYVLDPAEAPLVSPSCEDGGVRPPWLLWLAITLGVLFLIMVLMNIFLCTAMSCSCARTEIIEKEPSIIEEYDPYRSWHGSQYGSRYSLHGRDGHNKGYTSGGSTIHSNRSLPIDSDHYAIVHSRPGSRHSNAYGHRSRGPSSNY